MSFGKMEYKGCSISIYQDELGDLAARVGGLNITIQTEASDDEGELKLTRAARAVIDAYFSAALQEEMLAGASQPQAAAGTLLKFRQRG